MSTASPLFRYRAALLAFMVGLVLSGVTAFPLLAELNLLARLVGPPENPAVPAALAAWIHTVRIGLEATYAAYPWIAYGTDWLALGHIVIAAFFVGPFLHPLTSRSALYTGIFACLAVVPLALICGHIRGIPLYWRLLDCSFGVFGILPLLYCLRQLPRIQVEAALHGGVEGQGTP